ncbi:hypothetical protein G6F37_008422 [Rhizopus arrhizus]|nr:hypothetical protein G6F38_008427 [Rhizopus arrhizus]KAG1155569.1 hypothetical protein G6F37_008422 [Rhizopus arrhizus]
MDEGDDLFDDDIFNQDAIAAIDAQVYEYTSTQQTSNENQPIQHYASQPSTHVNNLETEKLKQTIEELKFQLEKHQQDSTRKERDLQILQQRQAQLVYNAHEFDRLKRQMAVLRHNQSFTKKNVLDRLSPESESNLPRKKAAVFPTSSSSSRLGSLTQSQIDLNRSEVKATQQQPQQQFQQQPSPPQLIKVDPTDSEQVNSLLRVLLGPVFQQWNIQHHENRRDFTMSLSPKLLKEFSIKFAKQIIPTTDNEAKERLSLLASDLAEYIIKCESASFASLRNISSIIFTLTSKFVDDTAYHLYKDLILGSTSTLHKLSQTLDLYCFYDKPLMQVIQDNPDIADRSYTEIMAICDQYNTTPVEITNDLNRKRKPEFAEETVLNLLRTFSIIVHETDDTPLLPLIGQEGFIHLLSSETPINIIEECLMLIQSIDMVKRKEEVMSLANKLADLVSTQQGSYTTHQWHRVRRMSLNCLYDMTKAGIQLKKNILEKLVRTAEDVITYSGIPTTLVAHEEVDRIFYFIFKILLLTLMEYPEVINEKYSKEFEKFIKKVGDFLDEKYYAYNVFQALERHMSQNIV